MMNGSIRRRRGASWTCRLLIALIALSGAAAFAEELPYVTRDGKTLTLTRSENEVGVVLNKAAVAAGRTSKLSGRLINVAISPECPVKLLKLDAANGITRASVASDPIIREVHPVYRFSTSPHPIVGTGTLIAKVRPGQTPAELNALFSEYGVEVVEALEGLPDVYLLAPKGNPDECVRCAADLAHDPRVVWSQPNFRMPVRPNQVTVQDPFFSKSWHLNNTGQQGGVPDADIDALEAWSVANGQDIRFGMFDDSADFRHEDLRDSYIGTGHDPTVPSNNEDEFEDPSPKILGDNHGTRVLGLAVARANTLGSRGVAFQAEWTASRGLNEFLTNAQQASVYTFAIQQNVDVHINSWGFIIPGLPVPAVIAEAIERAFDVGRNKGNLDEDEGDDPLGMVIVFASGNFGIEDEEGTKIFSLPHVIGVGASTDEDRRASYSEFGRALDVLAPSGGDFIEGLIFTTDNGDNQGYPDAGANEGGVNLESGFPLIEDDQTGNYTQYFSGTSAACPIAAGVAGLILSANPLLSAVDVRMIMIHTTDKIEPEVADYDGITSHSLTHGYGRINAKAAVDAAVQSLDNGGLTWPPAPAFVTVEGNQVRFRQNERTRQFLIVTSEAPFEFIPQDGTCYSKEQIGCTNAEPTPLPSGVTIHAVGCGLRCGASPASECNTGDENCFDFVADRTRYFGIYAYNSIGRYSYGVSVDSNGNVSGAEEVIRGEEITIGGSSGGGGGGGSLPSQGPAVTIMASPLEGESPLTVRFTGNAVSAVAIDNSRTQWDFDTSDGILVDSTQRNTTHTYTVAPGETRTFVARLTMFDVNGNAGFAQVSIQVRSPDSGTDGGPVGSEDLRIIVSVPGSPGSDVTQGTSPFDVLLTIDAGTVLGTVQSVVWDLGDGTRLTGLTVPHTYINESDAAIRLPITATVTTRNETGATATNTTTRLITILPGTETTTPEQPNLPGTGVPGVGGRATPCGAVGMIPLLGLMFSLSLLRRRGR